MAGSAIDFLINNVGAAQGGIFFILFIFAIRILRQDAAEHKEEYKSLTKEMFTVVNKNTEASTKLKDSIDSLRDRIRVTT